jgi:hypothetical protein
MTVQISHCSVTTPLSVLFMSLCLLQCNAAVGVKAFFDMMHIAPHKVMLFGAACTQVTDPIAKASKRWHLTQVRYVGTCLTGTYPCPTKKPVPSLPCTGTKLCSNLP